jgi:Fe2+ or Zn2+ uptake regulation protein
MNTNPEQQEIADIRELIKKKGMRSTNARIAVLQKLINSSSPVSHAELSNLLVPIGFDKATVFRNLNDLADVGLVTKTELGDHVWRFEFNDPDNPHEGLHPHFYCVDCGSVTCLPEKDFQHISYTESAEIGNITEILIKGHCNNCMA